MIAVYRSAPHREGGNISRISGLKLVVRRFITRAKRPYPSRHEEPKCPHDKSLLQRPWQTCARETSAQAPQSSFRSAAENFFAEQTEQFAGCKRVACATFLPNKTINPVAQLAQGGPLFAEQNEQFYGAWSRERGCCDCDFNFRDVVDRTKYTTMR
jgi:hypothetical protein